MDQPKIVPELVTIIHDWWKASPWTERYMFKEANSMFHCKCCGTAFLKVASDRIYWGLYPRNDPKYEKHEMIAADTKLFDQINFVFENARHDWPWVPKDKK